jgi:assimilatory nitrate reductase electron transfer subunit
VLTGGAAPRGPTRTVVRLAAPDLDVVSLGRPEALRHTGPGTETVTLSDPARRRYARLVLRDGRIAGAVLVGLPRGIAATTQLYDRDAPVPPGRLDLLLGTPARRSGPVELPDDAVICLCYNVAKGVVAQAWRGGARDLPALATVTRATTGCGSCADDVRRVCASLETAA